jgi:HSP20 family protein
MGITEKITALLPRKGKNQAGGRAERSDLLALHDDFDRWLQRFFDEPWAFHPLAGATRAPTVDLRETDDAVVVRAEVPGMGKDDIDLTLSPEGLVIRGEKREEKKQGKDAMEWRYGSFIETVPLPPGVDVERAEARVDNGVVTVRFPKTGVGAGSRRIPIQT